MYMNKDYQIYVERNEWRKTYFITNKQTENDG